MDRKSEWFDEILKGQNLLSDDNVPHVLLTTFYFHLILASTSWSRCSYHPQLEMSKQRKVTFLNSRMWIKAAGFQSPYSGHLKMLDKTFPILTKELLKSLLTDHLNVFRALGNTLYPAMIYCMALAIPLSYSLLWRARACLTPRSWLIRLSYGTCQSSILSSRVPCSVTLLLTRLIWVNQISSNARTR